MRQVRTMVGIMAMDTTQSTWFDGVNSLGVLGCIRGRNKGFRDHRLRECDFNNGFNMGQFRTSMGGMTSDITQGARLCMRRRGQVSQGGFVFGCPLVSFAFLSWSCHHRGRVLGRYGGHGGNGGSKGDWLNRCQSKIMFGVTRWGSGWSVTPPV